MLCIGVVKGIGCFKGEWIKWINLKLGVILGFVV